MELMIARWTSIALLAIAFGALAHAAVRPRDVVPAMGHRGRVRERTRKHLWFRVLEPWLALGGHGLAQLHRGKSIATLDRWLRRSGDHLGLSAHELIALACIQSLAAALVLAGCAPALGQPAWLGVACGLTLGALAPIARVRQHGMLRALHVERGLPEAIDLMALCMSGGLDFAHALHAVLNEGSLRHKTLHEEIERVVEGLALGQTRAEALRDFAERTAVPAAHDLVNAVLQAERTGTPLRTVLEIQAQMLRLRRSTLAEEAAARAALLLLLPLCLLLGAMLVMLFGPFVIRGVGL